MTEPDPTLAADLATRVLYQDAHVLILDKPPGIAVHPGPGGGPSLEPYLDGLRFGFQRRPELAHRLDRDTAGCLVLGRHPKALKRLGQAFAGGTVAKTYWAVVLGGREDDSGVIDQALAKISSAAAGWRMVIDPKGQRSVTEWRVLGRAGTLSWLELTPKTGRTHQIRVHCQHLGHPILGDPVYGGGGRARLHLLARAIAVPYSAERAPIQVVAEPPPHMVDALSACGWTAAARSA